MSTPARRPRLRFAIMSAVLLIAATASVVIANFIGSRVALRWDVTATREHQLSPRTLSLLARVEAPYEIVIAAPLRDQRTIHPRALQRIADVLDRFQRSGRLITISMIDTGSPAGHDQYSALVHRLAERDAPRIQRQLQTMQGVTSGLEELAAILESFAPRLHAIREAIPAESANAAANRAYFEQRAAECRASAAALRELATRATEILAPPPANPEDLFIPDVHQAAAPLRQPLSDLSAGLAAVNTNLRAFADADAIPAAARDLARPLVQVTARARDRSAILRDTLDRLERLDIARVASVLESISAALVIGPPDVGLTAIDFTSLFPPPAVLESAAGARADLGRNAEELLGTAIASLAHPIKPIVVLVHGQPRGYFERQPFFRLMIERLGLRGIDLVMWEAAVDPEPPSLARLDPAGNRPVVYICFNADSPSGSGGPGNTGPERAQRLGRALRSIIDAGHPLLLSIYPSTLPTYGEADPTTVFLAEFGLAADSARPLLRERITAEGRRVDAVQNLRARESAHPISQAVRGLPTRFEWPIALRLLEQAGEARSAPSVTPLYTIEDRATWGESQWLGYLQVPLAQHHLVPNPPSPDSPRDDTSGSWIVGAAAERKAPGLDHSQRLVVVGSNTWFVDWVVGDMSEVDGRAVAASPGNAELLEAAVYWLAGQDELIAQSPTARAAPLIGDLSPSLLRALRLAAIAGLPGLVLVAGAFWRVLRG
jgi:hypothetical protein